MLQRAADNACSWWWASHIRTKQSKWLESSLQDVEENVNKMIKLIQEDGDSFAKRAEMYYKRRPELISAVEESYRAFKALADRYDHLSKELQNANHTIATVFPEQLHFAIDEDEETTAPKLPKIVPGNTTNIPNAPAQNLKALISTSSQQIKARKSVTENTTKSTKTIVKSGLNRDEALTEIDKLHKDILSLQTVKEFVKSSYETGFEKYWTIENQITELQDKVCKLQDEFDVEYVIEDGEARTLMAEAALKSCKDTLGILQEKQEKSTREAKEEFKKVESAGQRLKLIRSEVMKEDGNGNGNGDKTTKEEIEVLEEENKNQLKKPDSDLTVMELNEKMDELVNKVISLESAVSTQTVMINTLRTEADDLHMLIKKLEDEKESLMGDMDAMRLRLKEMEEKLKRLESLKKNVEDQNTNLQSDFMEANSYLIFLSEKLSTVKLDEGTDESTKSEKKLEGEIKDVANNEQNLETPVDVVSAPMHAEKTGEAPTEDVKEIVVDVPHREEEEVQKMVDETVTIIDEKPNEQQQQEKQEEDDDEEDVPDKPVKAKALKEDINWQQILLSGTEDREAILLKEYTAILKNYKEVRQQLRDTEKKERDTQFNVIVQMRNFKQDILKRDQVIQRLREKLSHDNINSDDSELLDPEDTISTNNKDEMKIDTISPTEERLRHKINSILDENLDFWLRFSPAFHQVQKFKSEVQDLQFETSKLKGKKKNEAHVRSEARPIYKHLREIHAELSLWLEQSDSLKDELKQRFESLCGIQEEITKALEEGVDDEETRFGIYRAVKLQGEIVNMQQENSKVSGELQTMLDIVSELKVETEKTLRKLNEEFGIKGDEPKLRHKMSKSRSPLRTFLFGMRSKKNKNSIFSFMHPSRKYHVVAEGGVPALTGGPRS